MISKKVIGPTLAGTGAVGAPGALAWTLSLFDGESQEDPGKQPEVQTAQDSQVGTGGDKGVQQIGSASSIRPVTSTLKPFFDDGGEATKSDRESIEESITWEVKWNSGMGSLWVQAEGAKREDGTKFLWRCNVKAVSIEGINPTMKGNADYSGFIRQKGILEQALNIEEKKKQFVKNCSEARLDDEKKKGEDSEIELEAEQADSWDKYKFKESDNYFEKVWSEDFTGIYRLSKEDKEIANKDKNWSIKGEKGESGNAGKVTIFPIGKENKWKCFISGTSDKALGSRTFKDEEEKLKEILEFSESSSEIEKKRYLFKNCRKNSMAIKGLKIRVNGSRWWFDEGSLKKIYAGMYENPTTTVT